MNNVLDDLKFAARLLAKTPGFSALTIAVMAVGMGLTVYMLSLVYMLAFADLPLQGAQRLYYIDRIYQGEAQNGGNVELLDFIQMRRQQQSFTELGAFQSKYVSLADAAGARRLFGAYVSSGAFAGLGTPAYQGRTLGSADDELGAERVAVISYSVWEANFLKRPGTVGKQVKIDGVLHTIVGIMPPGFGFPQAQDVWMPLQIDANAQRRGQGNTAVVFGRLRDGVAPAAAAEDLKLIATRLQQQFPESNRDVGFIAYPFARGVLGNGTVDLLYIMGSSVVLVLLLSCVNICGLMFGRAVRRSGEAAVRMAAGAPRARLVGQLICESVVISLISSVLALVGAAYAMKATAGVLRSAIDPLPFWWNFDLSGAVVLITLMVGIAASVLTGLFPALHVAMQGASAILRDGTRGALGRSASLLSKGAVIVEIALSCFLLVVAGLMTLSALRVVRADYGVDPQGVYTANLDVRAGTYSMPEQKQAFFNSLLRAVEDNSGLSAAALTTVLPGQYPRKEYYQPEGRTFARASEYPRTNRIYASPRYFDVFGVKLLSGRGFDGRDTADSIPVAIVGEKFASKLWPGTTAIGKRFRFRSGDEIEAWTTVIGVVPHIIHGQIQSNAFDQDSVYLPLTQGSPSELSIAIRSRLAESDNRTHLTQALRRNNSEMALYGAGPLATRFDQNAAGVVFIGKLFAVFAGFAYLLAASGIYGIMAYAVLRRTHEIGLRKAVGALESDIAGMLVSRGLIQAFIGIGIGLPLAFAGYGLLDTSGIESAVPLVFSGVVITLMAIVVFASYVPARKAIRLSAAQSLRYE